MSWRNIKKNAHLNCFTALTIFTCLYHVQVDRQQAELTKLTAELEALEKE